MGLCVLHAMMTRTTGISGNKRAGAWGEAI